MSVNHPSERTEVFNFNMIMHRNKAVKDFISLKDYSDFLENLDTVPFTYQTIDLSTHQRPDLFSSKTYNTPHLWWWLILFNNMTNPATEFVRDQVIKVPSVVPQRSGVA